MSARPFVIEPSRVARAVSALFGVRRDSPLTPVAPEGPKPDALRAADAERPQAPAPVGMLRDKPVLHLQPRVAVADTGIVGAQALAVWPRSAAQGASDATATLPPVADGWRLALWTFDEAARHWEYLRGSGAPLRIAVTLAGDDLRDADLPARLAAVLACRRVPAQAFCLDVPEAVWAAVGPAADALLFRLAAAGFRLALAGFGSAGARLDRLAGLPFEALTLAPAWLAAAHDDDVAARAVRAAARAGNALGWRVLADGVDDDAVRARLPDWGCDEAQGDAIGAPMLPADLPAWCAQWRARHAGLADARLMQTA